jgi:hypothetical protein
VSWSLELEEVNKGANPALNSGFQILSAAIAIAPNRTAPEVFTWLRQDVINLFYIGQDSSLMVCLTLDSGSNPE